MAGTLVHIVHQEILSLKRNFKAIGSDLDGNLTNLHDSRIFNLLWEVLLDFLPERLKERLEHYTFDDIKKFGEAKMCWYLDRRGFLVLPDQNGRILKVHNGDTYLSRDKILELYKGGVIEIAESKRPDYDKPEFLIIGDAFDFVEAFCKTALAGIHGLPRDSTIQAFEEAWSKTHHDEENGYKARLLKEPHKYGIRPNQGLTDFLEEANGRFFTFVVTASREEDARKLLDTLGITHCFDLVIAGVNKPACFYAPISKNLIWQELANRGISSPETVFYTGDHPYKDGWAKKLGFKIGLRMPRTFIDEIFRKFTKYAGVKFKVDDVMRKPVNKPNKEQLSHLSNLLYLFYTNVDVMYTKVQNLAPILLY